MKKLILLFILAFAFHIGFSQTTLKDGVGQLERENFTAAQKIFRGILQKDPKNAGAWFYLGQIAYMDEKADSAAWYFNKAREVNENSYFSHIGAGLVAQDNKKALDADKAFGKAKRYANDKELPEALSLIGQAYLMSRNPDVNKAVAAFTAARDADTKNVKHFVKLGDAQLAKGTVGDALTNYELASNKDKNNPEILMKIARAYSKNNIPDVAIDQLEKVIAQFPDYAPAYKDLYQLYFEKGQYSKVTPVLEKYVALVGTDVEQRARLVKFLTFQAKDYKRAIEEANIVLKQDPKNYTMYRWLAWSHFEAGDYQSSFDASKKFFENNAGRQTYASDYDYYARAASKLNQVDVAVENYKKVLELDSTRTDIYDFIAKAYFDNKKWPEAERAYTEKVTMSKPSNQDYYYLGMTQYYQKRFTTADSTFGKLTELQPTYATGWLMRAKANLNIDSTDTPQFLAKPYYEKYVELASADPEKYKKNLIEAYNYLGYYFSQNDDLNASTAWFEKTVALDPNDETAKNALVELKNFSSGKRE